MREAGQMGVAPAESDPRGVALPVMSLVTEPKWVIEPTLDSLTVVMALYMVTVASPDIILKFQSFCETEARNIQSTAPVPEEGGNSANGMLTGLTSAKHRD